MGEEIFQGHTAVSDRAGFSNPGLAQPDLCPVPSAVVHILGRKKKKMNNFPSK